VAHPVVALVAGPSGWVQDVNFVVLGSLMIAFAIGLHPGVRPTRWAVLGPGLFALSGIGPVWAGASCPRRRHRRDEQARKGEWVITARPASRAMFGRAFMFGRKRPHVHRSRRFTELLERRVLLLVVDVGQALGSCSETEPMQPSSPRLGLCRIGLESCGSKFAICCHDYMGKQQSLGS